MLQKATACTLCTNVLRQNNFLSSLCPPISAFKVALDTSRSIHTSSVCRWDEYDNNEYYKPGERVYRRGWNALSYDWRRWKRRIVEVQEDAFQRRTSLHAMHPKLSVIDQQRLPAQAQYVIIGGGIVGSSVAWWLKQRMRNEDYSVVVVESDHTFSQASTMLSAGGVRQQFSIPESVQMSLFASEFMRNAGEYLKIEDNDPPDINLDPMGYLFLATTEESAADMQENWRMQTQLGAKVALFTREQLQQRFPFMVLDDIVMGSFGLQNEGAIDAWQIMSALREKNLTLGVQYVKGTVDGFGFRRLDRHGEVDRPVHDPKGLNFSPRIITVNEQDATIDHTNLDVDYEYFQEYVWPVLAARIPAFENLKMKSAWAGYYDYNTFDENAIIGKHPAFDNFWHCCGFSGHGLQHAFAAG